MQNQEFKVSITAVWCLVLGSFIFTILGALFKVMHWEKPEIFLISGLLLSGISWIVVVSDMYRSKIQNLNFWVILMFLAPGIAAIAYLTQRKKLIEFGESE